MLKKCSNLALFLQLTQVEASQAQLRQIFTAVHDYLMLIAHTRPTLVQFVLALPRERKEN
jgi:hypothetical protein